MKTVHKKKIAMQLTQIELKNFISFIIIHKAMDTAFVENIINTVKVKPIFAFRVSCTVIITIINNL